MSRLWNKIIGRLGSTPMETLGLAIGSMSLAFAVTSVAQSRAVLRASGVLPYGFRLFSGEPAADAAARLAGVLSQLPGEIRAGIRPVQIALPDAAVSLRVLELGHLPKRADQRAALVRWRFARLLGVDAATLACAFQDMSGGGGKPLVLATAIDRRWLDVVQVACRTAGLVPAVIDMSVNFHFNAFHDRFAPDEDGALVVIEPAGASLMLWDKERRPTFVQGRTPREEDAIDIGIVAAEAERLIRAYVHAAPGRKIARVAVTGTDEQRDALADLLDSRVQTPCLRLDPAALCDDAAEAGRLLVRQSSTALVASMSR